MSELDELTEFFKNFPGIGDRQARRFSYYFSKLGKATRERFIDKLSSVSDMVSECKMCRRVHMKSGAEVCDICSDSTRETSLLLVLEKDSDFENINTTRKYDGLYFILGGTIPISHKIPTYIKLGDLEKRIKEGIESGDLKEVILAFSLNRDGENTREYVEDFISQKFGDAIKISKLGRGLSSGSEIEYSDGDTLEYALKGRS